MLKHDPQSTASLPALSKQKQEMKDVKIVSLTTWRSVEQHGMLSEGIKEAWTVFRHMESVTFFLDFLVTLWPYHPCPPHTEKKERHINPDLSFHKNFFFFPQFTMEILFFGLGLIYSTFCMNEIYLY